MRGSELPQQTRLKGAERLQMAFNGLFADQEGGAWSKADKQDGGVRSSLTSSTATRTTLQSAKTPNSTSRRSALVSSSYDRPLLTADPFFSPTRGGRTIGSKSPTHGTGYAKRHSHRAVHTVGGVSTGYNPLTTSSAVKTANLGGRTTSPAASPIRHHRQQQPVKPSPNRTNMPVGAATSAVIAALAMDAALPNLDATAMALLETIMGTSLDASSKQEQQQPGPSAAPNGQPEPRSPMALVPAAPQAQLLQPVNANPTFAPKSPAAAVLQGDAKGPVLTQQLLQQHQQQFAHLPRSTYAGMASSFDRTAVVSTPSGLAGSYPGPELKAVGGSQPAGLVWPPGLEGRVVSPTSASAETTAAMAQHHLMAHAHGQPTNPTMAQPQMQATQQSQQQQQVPGTTVAGSSTFVFGGGVASASKMQQPQAVPVGEQEQVPVVMAQQQQSPLTARGLTQGPQELGHAVAQQHAALQQPVAPATDRETCADATAAKPAVVTDDTSQGQGSAPVNNSGSDSETPTRRPPNSQSSANIAQQMGSAAATAAAAAAPGGGGTSTSPGSRGLLKRMCWSQGHSGMLSNKVMRAPNKDEVRRPTTYAELQAVGKMQSSSESPLAAAHQQTEPLKPEPQQLIAAPAALAPAVPSAAGSHTAGVDSQDSRMPLPGTGSRDLAAAAAAYTRLSSGRHSGGAPAGTTLSERRPSSQTNMVVLLPLTSRKPALGEASPNDTTAQWSRSKGTARRSLFGSLLACFGCTSGAQPNSPEQGAGESAQPAQHQILSMPPPALLQPSTVSANTLPLPLQVQPQQQPAKQQSTVVAVAKALALSPGSAAAAAKSDSRLLSLLRAELETTPEEPSAAAAGPGTGAPETIPEHPREGDAEGCNSPADTAAADGAAKEPAPESQTCQQQQSPQAGPEGECPQTPPRRAASGVATAGEAGPTASLPAPAPAPPAPQSPAPQQSLLWQAGQSAIGGSIGGINLGVPGGVSLQATTLSPQMLRHEDGDSVLRGSVDTNTTSITFSPIPARSQAVPPQRASAAARPAATGSGAGAAEAQSGADQTSRGSGGGHNMDAAAILSYCSSSSIMRARMLMAASEASSAKGLQQHTQHQVLGSNLQQSGLPEAAQVPPQQPQAQSHSPAPALSPSIPETRYPTDLRDSNGPCFGAPCFSSLPLCHQQQPSSAPPQQPRPEGPSFGPAFNAIPAPRSNRKRGRATNAYGCGLSQLDARKLAAMPLEEMLEQIQAAIYAEDLANGRVQNTSGGGMSDDGSILPMPPVMGGKGRNTSVRRRKSTAGGRSTINSAVGTLRGGRGSDGGNRVAPGIGAVQTTMTKAGLAGAVNVRRRRRVKVTGSIFKAPVAACPNPSNSFVGASLPAPQPVWRHGGRALAFNGLGFAGSSGSTSPRAGAESCYTRQPPYKKPLLCASTVGAATSGGGSTSPRVRPPGSLNASAQQLPHLQAGSKTSLAPGCVLTAFATSQSTRRFTNDDDAGVGLGPGSSGQGLTSSNSNKLFHSSAKQGGFQPRFVLGTAGSFTAGAGADAAATAAAYLSMSACDPEAPTSTSGAGTAAAHCNPEDGERGAAAAALAAATGPVTSSLNISDLLSRFNSDSTGHGSLSKSTSHGLGAVSSGTAAAPTDSLLLSDLLPSAVNGASGTSQWSAAAAPATAKAPVVVPLMAVHMLPPSAAGQHPIGHPNPAKQSQLVNTLLAAGGKRAPTKPRIVSVSLTELLLRAEQTQQQTQQQMRRSTDRASGLGSAASTEGGVGTTALVASASGDATAHRRESTVPTVNGDSVPGGGSGSVSMPKAPSTAPSSRRSTGAGPNTEMPGDAEQASTGGAAKLPVASAVDTAEGAGESRGGSAEGGPQPVTEVGAKAVEDDAQASSPIAAAAQAPLKSAHAPEATRASGGRYLELLQAQGPGSGRTTAPLPHYALPIRSRATSAVGEPSGCVEACARSLACSLRPNGGSAGGGVTGKPSGSYAQMAGLRYTSAPPSLRNTENGSGVISNGGDSNNGNSNGDGDASNGSASCSEGGACHVPNVMDAGSGNNSPINAMVARPGSPGCSSVVAHLPSTAKAVEPAVSVPDTEVESGGKTLLEDTADSGVGSRVGQGQASRHPVAAAEADVPALSDEAEAPCAVEQESSAQMSNDGDLWAGKDMSTEEDGRLSPRLVELPETPKRSLGTPGADWRCVPLEAYEQSLGEYDAYLAAPSDDG